MNEEQRLSTAMQVAEKAVADGLWDNALALKFVEHVKAGRVDPEAWVANPVMIELASIALENMRS